MEKQNELQIYNSVSLKLWGKLYVLSIVACYVCLILGNFPMSWRLEIISGLVNIDLYNNQGATVIIHNLLIKKASYGFQGHVLIAMEIVSYLTQIMFFNFNQTFYWISVKHERPWLSWGWNWCQWQKVTGFGHMLPLKKKCRENGPTNKLD